MLEHKKLIYLWGLRVVSFPHSNHMDQSDVPEFEGCISVSNLACCQEVHAREVPPKYPHNNRCNWVCHWKAILSCVTIKHVFSLQKKKHLEGLLVFLSQIAMRGLYQIKTGWPVGEARARRLDNARQKIFDTRYAITPLGVHLNVSGDCPPQMIDVSHCCGVVDP